MAGWAGPAIVGELGKVGAPDFGRGPEHLALCMGVSRPCQEELVEEAEPPWWAAIGQPVTQVDQRFGAIERQADDVQAQLDQLRRSVSSEIDAARRDLVRAMLLGCVAWLVVMVAMHLAVLALLLSP